MFGCANMRDVPLFKDDLDHVLNILQNQWECGWPATEAQWLKNVLVIK